MEWIREIFAQVCCRCHCWFPGGEALPFCQRCTGLYVGAAAAVLLYFLFRPRPTPLFLLIHGLLLLVMVPFGYHLVPHGGDVRMLTGQLFAVGLVGYLSLLPLGRRHLQQPSGRRASWGYALGVAASTAILFWAVHRGGPIVGIVLAWVGLAGFVALTALVIANLVLLPSAVWRSVPRVTRRFLTNV